MTTLRQPPERDAENTDHDEHQVLRVLRGSAGREPGEAPDPAPPGGDADEETDELAARRRLRVVGPRADRRPIARARHLRDVIAQGLDDAGMATAEYAIATLAAVGFAGLLVVILKGNEVRGLLTGIIKRALSL
ncbi:DUF4244 domain-containing protein [Cellulomonas edaphi]|uniref:DUF4244 domain-containing protein n=1 Tax=Cellulomonas edaphi TaxID=3053468 RepID=A0ABT7S9J9_9CELL|nr:DUF4244 domain-containing protein [Cellulomons edaphi]MDM7832286.1 DUF4244 domain-containing protein [Cellulomons edaphi]